MLSLKVGEKKAGGQFLEVNQINFMVKSVHKIMSSTSITIREKT